ncbi:MAG TPA: Stk1 family PASTA domain-containing Ser/Thr kinase [Egibacteraceae bacterium]|nr:Stk1 family PASTA domain-containing Ser/Thr kinase [Egibacteraceae bacterium]
MSDETTPLTGGNRRTINGRYLLRGLLGQGGMADVELAHDEILDRQVAVKILHNRYTDDPSFVDRFRREARASASMSHPNVVGVYDTGEDDGRPYIVMEYVAGQSLRDVLRRKRLTPERAAEIARDAARALHYAHERGLVHRDVKPGNIMVSEEGQVKVTDFGIARAMSAETVTQTAAVLGTAAYIAPEQAQGERVDRRTDVYALGCVLYEMLTGRQPFSGDSAVTLAYKHVSEPPVPPSELRAEISPELEAVVLKAMAKRPDDRYQTADEMAEDLERAVAGMGVTAPLAGTAAFPATQALPRAEQTIVAERAYYADEQPVVEERRSPVGPILLVLLLLAVLGLAAFLLADVFRTDPVAEVAVPDVTGQDISAAQAALQAEGFQTVLEAEENADVPENTVIRTDPPAGAMVDEGSTVTIFYSEGPPLVDVPDLAGVSEDEARRRLTDLRFTVGARETEASEEHAEGQVIRTDPPAGDSVPTGTEVALVVSSGPPPLTLPGVIDLTERDAVNELTTFCGRPPCVEIDVRREFHGRVQEGRVIDQGPRPGTEVPRGAPVTIIVSQGPEEEPTTTTTTAAPSPDPTPIPPPTTVPEPINSPSPAPTGPPGDNSNGGTPPNP